MSSVQGGNVALQEKQKTKTKDQAVRWLGSVGPCSHLAAFNEALRAFCVLRRKIVLPFLYN